jgi:hypothetical protein
VIAIRRACGAGKPSWKRWQRRGRKSTPKEDAGSVGERTPSPGVQNSACAVRAGGHMPRCNTRFKSYKLMIETSVDIM